MAEYTERHRTDEWVEWVLTCPTNWAELSKAFNAATQYLDPTGAGASLSDDVVTVHVTDEEVILRTKARGQRLSVSWADRAVNAALARLLDYREGRGPLPAGDQALAVAIDALRAIGADVGSDD